MDHRGHLVDREQMNEEEWEALSDDYEEIPEEYREQAQLELMGKKSTFVGMKASGTLSKHARYLKRKRDKKNKQNKSSNKCYAG